MKGFAMNGLARKLGLEKDLWVKLAAVAMACILWFFVITRAQAGITMEVPVEFIEVPDGLYVAGEGQHNVSLSISGHERFLRKLTPEDIRVSLSLQNIKSGEHTLRIDETNVQLPSAFRVVGVTPSSITITAEGKLTRTVPIRANIIGSPLEGYSTRSVEVTPGEATVEGVRTALKNLKYIGTRPVDISSASQTVQDDVELDLPDEGITSSITTVTVRVVIAKERR